MRWWRERLLKILKEVQEGSLAPEEALTRLRHLPFEDLGYARVDHHRSLRKAYPEVIYCQGKEAQQVKGIASALLAQGVNLLATRANEEIYQLIKELNPAAVYHPIARLVVQQSTGSRQRSNPGHQCRHPDLPVAEEAALVAESWESGGGLYDVGWQESIACWPVWIYYKRLGL